MTRFHGHKGLPILFFPFIFVGMAAAAASPDLKLLSLVPPGAQLVAGISAPSTQGQPDNFVLITHSNSVDLEDFYALSGADGTRIIHQIVFVAIAFNQGPLSEHSLLVSGHFDQPRLFRSAADGGAAVMSYRSIPVLEIQPFARERNTFNDARWLAVLDSNILVFGTIAATRLELDRYLGANPTDPSLSRHLAHLRSKDEIWCVLSAPTRNDDIHRVLAALNPRLADLAQSGEAFEFGIHYGRRVEFEYEVIMASTQNNHFRTAFPLPSSAELAKGVSLLPAPNTIGEADTLHDVIEVSVSRYKEWLARTEHARSARD
jgi:hypothetical protein